MPLTNKNKCGLVKVPVHFNIYQPEFLTKCPFGLVVDQANVTDCIHQYSKQYIMITSLYPSLEKAMKVCLTVSPTFIQRNPLHHFRQTQLTGFTLFSITTIALILVLNIYEINTIVMYFMFPKKQPCILLNKLFIKESIQSETLLSFWTKSVLYEALLSFRTRAFTLIK